MISQKDCYTLCIRKGEEVQSLKLETGHYLSLFYGDNGEFQIFDNNEICEVKELLYSTADLLLAFDYFYKTIQDFILTNEGLK